MKKYILIALLFSQPLLADGYSKFYEANPYTTVDDIAKRRAAPPPETPVLVRYSDTPEVINAEMTRKGYMPIGHSNFTSGWAAKDKGALKLGIKVKADLVVVISPEFKESITSNIPITTPTSQTTFHNGQATVYGSGGSATAYGSGTSTTYGSKTTYIPITTNRYEYGAIFYVKVKMILGINNRMLNDAERRQLQTNSGIVVTSVVEGTPAFENDVLPGDFILRINDESLSSDEKFHQLLDANTGKSVELLIIRDGQQITKTIKLL